MRVARRIVAYRWSRGVALAMFGMAGLVLVIILNFRTAPLSADTMGNSAPFLRNSQFPTLSPTPLPAPFADLRRQLLPSSAAAVMPAALETTADVRFYQGQKFHLVKTLALRVTAYAPDPRCTHPYAGTTTASGLSVTTNGGHLAAADTSIIPMHDLVVVPGYAGDAPVPVLDRGSAIKGHRLDVLLPTYTSAQAWGARVLKVRIYQPLTSAAR